MSPHTIANILAVLLLPIVAPVWLVLGILAKAVNWSKSQVREFLR